MEPIWPLDPEVVTFLLDSKPDVNLKKEVWPAASPEITSARDCRGSAGSC
jgi:hypothetical protein